MFGLRFAAKAVAVRATTRGITNLIPKQRSMNAIKIGVALGTTAFISTYAIAESAAAPLDIAAIRTDIIAAIESEDEKRKDGSSIQGTLIRLAWHASGTFCNSTKTGGSNGATMRCAPESEWGANAGLKGARDFLEPIKSKYPNLSYADLWTLAGVVAVENMGGPNVPWRSGRSDSAAPTSVPDGRLPAADSGAPKDNASHVRMIFNRMGFNDQEIVALLAAHSVGRCHANASGYVNPWTYSETTFSNEFHRLLIDGEWTVKKTEGGQPWKGPLQYESPDGKIMMLPADLILVQDAEFRKYVELYAKDEEKMFTDFSSAFSKSLELGVTFEQPKSSGWWFW